MGRTKKFEVYKMIGLTYTYVKSFSSFKMAEKFVLKMEKKTGVAYLIHFL